MKKITLITLLFFGLATLSGCNLFRKPGPESETEASEIAPPPVLEKGVVDGDITEKETENTAEESEEKSEEKTQVKTEVTVQTRTEVPASEIKNFKIGAKDFTFTPNTITVKEGETVQIDLSSVDQTYGLVIPDFGVNKVVNPGAPVRIEFVANKKGNFTFRCSVMCGENPSQMSGTLTVN